MNKSKKNIIICIIIIFLVILERFVSHNYMKYKEYKNLLRKAEAYMHIENYDKAIENYETSLKCKSNKEVINKINLAKEIKRTTEEEKNIKQENKNLQEQVITKDEAEKIVKNKIGTVNNNVKVTCEREEVRSGVMYYLIHVYEVVQDHTATIGWYYVRKDNGQVFLWDLVTDILKPIN